MNINAANSLLKLLEEPPLGSMLLLVTSHPARLPATIRSRCSHILFKTPARATGLDWLQKHGGMTQPEILLELASGAPLLAEALALEGFPEIRVRMLQDLEALNFGREEPVACATRWKTFGTERCLSWMYRFVSEQIKAQLEGRGPVAPNPLAASLLGKNKNKYKINELYNFIDVIHENYRRLGGPLDELLILEEVLIRWTRLSRLQ
jgi:DNA polymerase-3 subunit delta'